MGKWLRTGLLIYAISLALHVKCQENYYFLNEPVWNVYTQNAHQFPCMKLIQRNHFLGQAQIFDTLTYFPIYERMILTYDWQSVIEPYPFCNGSISNDSILKGYLRSSGKQVYFRASSANPEQLLYDFNLEIGETIQNSPLVYNETLIVADIDSFQVANGDYWKTFTLTGNNYVTHLIEGIGSSAGLLEDMTKPYNLSSQLQCYAQHGGSYYPSTNELACVFYLELPEMKFEFSIYPNPVTETISIKSSDNYNEISYSIYDFSGKLQKSGAFIGIIDLEINNWNSGVYYIEFSSDSEFFSRQKFIKL